MIVIWKDPFDKDIVHLGYRTYDKRKIILWCSLFIDHAHDLLGESVVNELSESPDGALVGIEINVSRSYHLK